MGRYVEGFVVPVPAARIAEYARFARKCAKIWREYGALECVECVAVDAPFGKRTSFPRSVKLKPDEVVVFAWIAYRSRRERDRVFKQVMADPRLSGMSADNMPFDPKRMFWGGFKTIVEE